MRIIQKLKFDNPTLEKEFLQDYFEKSIMIVRIAIGMAILLYSVFSFLDYYISPLSKNVIWFIRFAVVIPVMFVGLFISYLKLFQKYMQIILTFLSLGAGFGIIAMISIVRENVSSLYYAGLILVLMWSYTLVKLRFIYATVSCWIIVLAYEIVTIFIQDLLTTPQHLIIFINNNFFFISSNILGMFACYMIELYTRKDFLQRREIATNREELVLKHNELERRVEIMNDELEMARVIQQKLIPTKNTIENIYSFYKPMSEVGGDLFDFIHFDDKSSIGIFISDVSGHGLPAALITTMVKSNILKSKEYYSNPAKLLMYLNESLCELTDENFVTAFYGIYNISKRSITYSNAGHQPPFAILNNKILLLDRAKSLPLIMMNNAELLESKLQYKNSTAILPKNSKIFFYTDGLVEAKHYQNPTIDFGKVIKEKILKFKYLNGKIFIENIYNSLIQFRGKELFEDDICLICVDIN